ncbi:hypothetical protein ANO14919_044760 [Xylariales sp. No.14919]|nr:hypothetical protein ANO14919_044760 [Xylariales sp. No.14919]
MFLSLPVQLNAFSFTRFVYLYNFESVSYSAVLCPNTHHNTSTLFNTTETDDPYRDPIQVNYQYQTAIICCPDLQYNYLIPRTVSLQCQLSPVV